MSNIMRMICSSGYDRSTNRNPPISADRISRCCHKKRPASSCFVVLPFAGLIFAEVVVVVAVAVAAAGMALSFNAPRETCRPQLFFF